MKVLGLLAGMLLIGLVVWACGPGAAPTPSPPAAPTFSATPALPLTPTASPAALAEPRGAARAERAARPEEAKAVVELAVADLAWRLGLERSAISIVQVQPVYHGDVVPPTPESEKSRQGRLPTVLTGFYLALGTPVGNYHYRTSLEQIEFLGQLGPPASP